MLQVALVCEVRSSHVFDVLEPFLQDATLVSGARLGRPLFGALVAALLEGLGKNIALVKVHTPHSHTPLYQHKSKDIHTNTRHIPRVAGTCGAKLQWPLNCVPLAFLAWYAVY